MTWHDHADVGSEGGQAGSAQDSPGQAEGGGESSLAPAASQEPVLPHGCRKRSDSSPEESRVSKRSKSEVWAHLYCLPTSTLATA